MRTALILEGCPTAPDSLIAGLPRRERLVRTLEKKGFQLVSKDSSEKSESHLKIPDCHVLVGDEEIHLCTEGIQKVESKLLMSLRKPADGMISRLLNRRISLFFTRLLMSTRIAPNHISILTFILGISSGLVLLRGGYVSGIIGALLLQAQSVLDGVDGELARLKFQTSRLGQWLDTLSDDVAEFSFLLGATLIQTFEPLRWLGILGVVSTIAAQSLLYYALATIYRSGDLQVMSWDLGASKSLVARLRFLFRHDFLCLLVVFLSLFNRIDMAIALVSIGRLVVLFVTCRQFFIRGFASPRKANQTL